ncbi:MAG: glycoside hydrolase family 6 protein [Kineosporiaceae bacterium]
MLAAACGSSSPEATPAATSIATVSASAGASTPLAAASTGPSASLSTSPAVASAQGDAGAVGTNPATWPLYRRPDTQAAQWVAAHRSDGRAAAISSAIVSRPSAVWLTQPDASASARAADRTVTAAVAAKAVPVLVLYALPNRDCGGASAGGTRTASAYRSWVKAVAASLKRRPVIVVVEPDSLALQTCLSGTALKERNALVSYAASTLRAADPSALIYLDAGHSNWNPPAEAAKRLRAAGLQYANGFFTNVSNYRTTTAEVAFGAAVRKALGSAGTGKNQVVDTSRNGNGPRGSEWCDPPGRKVGTAPARRPRAGVDAYLWVKLPGEADGCRGSAGQFVPDLAHALAVGR